MGHGRGQTDLLCKRSQSVQRRHPNWGHPDHDACGTGFVTRLGGAPSYEIIQISKLGAPPRRVTKPEEHTSELQSLAYLVCRLLLEKKKKKKKKKRYYKK